MKLLIKHMKNKWLLLKNIKIKLRKIIVKSQKETKIMKN